MPEDGLLSAMLNKAGLSLKDVTLINVNFSLSSSLISVQVDAVIGAFRNLELNQMDIVNRPGRAFFVEEEGVPANDELIIVPMQTAWVIINYAGLSAPQKRQRNFSSTIQEKAGNYSSRTDRIWTTN